MRSAASTLVMIIAISFVAEGEESPPELLSARVTQAPMLDGKGEDEVWKTSLPLEVTAERPLPPNAGASVPLTIQSVHTDTDVYFLVSWEDSTESVSHKTWLWNADSGVYEQGDDREDMLALAFEHTGPFNADMLDGIKAVWDVWHWKAFRTNPLGRATDKTHHYTPSKPVGKAKSHTAANDEEIWIARPEDAGDSVEKKRKAPTAFSGQRVAQYTPGTPTGSAADVRAKGSWASGRWTLELSRRLNTGHADDTTFERGRSYRMAIAAFDRTGDMDKASGVIELSFARSVSAQRFELDEAGTTPEGFSTVMTGRGKPGQWLVREGADAPSGRKVVVQVSDDPTNYRFPLLVFEELMAREVEVSVAFKPISGSVDQAAGLVWRFRDPQNYYVVRANALEDNVVLYKVEAGKRSNLKPSGSWFMSYGKKVAVQGGAWSVLRLQARGSHFAVWLNGEHLFDVDDETFSEAGKVGLWTKADSVTAFDDFSIKSYEAD